jgi:hypothetical protein
MQAKLRNAGMETGGGEVFAYLGCILQAGQLLRVLLATETNPHRLQHARCEPSDMNRKSNCLRNRLVTRVFVLQEVPSTAT